MAFIEIETKEDTAAKLAAISGKPTKNHLFATEINLIKNRIQTIWNAISGNLTIVEQNKVELGTIAQPFITILNERDTIAWESPVFVTYDIAGTYYTQAFVGQSGDYGDGSGEFVQEDFVLVEQSNAAPEVYLKREACFSIGGTFNSGELSISPISFFKNDLNLGTLATTVYNYEGVDQLRISFPDVIPVNRIIFPTIVISNGYASYNILNIEGGTSSDILVKFNDLTGAESFEAIIKCELV